MVRSNFYWKQMAVVHMKLQTEYHPARRKNIHQLRIVALNVQEKTSEEKLLTSIGVIGVICCGEGDVMFNSTSSSVEGSNMSVDRFTLATRTKDEGEVVTDLSCLGIFKGPWRGLL